MLELPIQQSAIPELLLALNASPELTRDHICRLASDIEHWIDTDPATTVAAIIERTGLPASKVRTALGSLSDARRSAQQQRQRARQLQASIVTWIDPDYPVGLLDLPQPPPVIHLLGRLPASPGVAIVGSRNADPYGLEAAELFGRGLATAGLNVVSGLARGVDGAAHRGALAAPGSTTAVLACGLDIVYPRSHVTLARRIGRHGALISEFPFGCSPLRHHFPIRNRLIAALGVGTLIVQATNRSGSLITAGQALELGRQIWAVPGSIFDQRANGTNRLLRDGAAPALEPRDIVEALPAAVRDRLEATSPASAPALPGDAGSVLSVLSRGVPRSPEELARATGLSVGATLAALSELELGSQVQRYAGPAFTRRAP